MGAGVAKQIRLKYPQVFTEYSAACAHNNCGLGDVQFVEINEYLYVCDLFGQRGYGRNELHTDYAAHRKAWPLIKNKSSELQLKVFAPYMIGCGLGGGNWDVLRPIIESACDVVWCRK